MNIKTRILLVVLALEVIGYSILINYNNQVTKRALAEIREDQIGELFQNNLTKINNLTHSMETKVKSLALVGELLWSLKQKTNTDLTEPLSRLLIKTFEDFPESIGGGLWYEPNTFDPHKKYFGPYVFWNNLNKVELSWDLNTPEYDYLNQNWYLQALPSTWPRTKKRADLVYWTAPYFDEAGSLQMMTTVDALMYNSDNKIIGLATVDWALEGVTYFIEKIKVTPNSFTFLIDIKNQQFLSFPKDPTKIMQSVHSVPWVKKQLEQVTSHQKFIKSTISISNKAYFIYSQKSNTDMLFGIIIPKKEYYGEIAKITKSNVMAGIVISGTFILLVLFSLYSLFKPFSRVLTLINNSINFDINNTLIIKPLNYQKKNEFSPIINKLNQVFDEVINHTDSIERINKDLIVKQAENNQLNLTLQNKIEEIIIEKTRAQQSSQAKSVFLANMSHELRTPLNIIIGYTELIIEDFSLLEIDNKQDFINDGKKILVASKHLRSIISDILDVSKIEAGKIEFKYIHSPLHNMIEEIEQLTYPLAKKNNNVLKIINQCNINNFYTDPLRLKQILFNLLSNACKFTKDGLIVLTLSNNKKQILFKVADNGIGIDKDDMDQLFQPFMQADLSTTKAYGGTGLGLTITQHLCQTFGGDIRIKNNDPQGVVFFVTLPITDL